jgi:hypothetical protein
LAGKNEGLWVGMKEATRQSIHCIKVGLKRENSDDDGNNKETVASKS